MADRDRKLQVQTDGRDPRLVAAAIKNIGDMLDPSVQISFSASQQIGRGRNIVLSVLDHLGQRWERRWPIRVYITTALDGDPSAAGNTLILAGPAFEFLELIAGAAYDYLTGPEGTLQFELQTAAAGTRYVYASVGGRFFGSGALIWS